MKEQPECPHNVIEKFVVARGAPGAFTGLLACVDCLTEKDLARIPGWKDRLAQSKRRAGIARQNFHK